jgi:hypothetical protein
MGVLRVTSPLAVGVQIPPRAQGISLGMAIEENQFLFKEQQKKRGCTGEISPLALSVDYVSILCLEKLGA